MVDASRPTMPAFDATSWGSDPTNDENRPNPYTNTNTYGTMKRKKRKATAAARTGPPAAASRWAETKAMSTVRYRGRAASSSSNHSSPLARAAPTLAFNRWTRDGASTG